MAKRVFVTPRAGSELVRNPADPSRRIAREGEWMIDSSDLRRLEIAGDVTIADSEPGASKAAKAKE